MSNPNTPEDEDYGPLMADHDDTQDGWQRAVEEGDQ